ncbi:MAG: cytochrome c3 family protein [Trueperaceae bacterium]|jgi:Zn finger protein HypA/HybF involved in hydrogenase expression|nr:cytochrome c3 family protein [Trueperaceae bacterium]
MPQSFPRNANAFAKWLVLGGSVFVVALMIALAFYARVTNNAVGVPVDQPVAFQHNLHAEQLGIDCRYCHTSVEVEATASVPPTETCMTCHSQIRVGDPQLAAVQASWDTGTPIQWNRVHDLADYVYFNHSAHINSGVGCSDCHGSVQEMAEIWKNEPLTMGWCLECHKAPEDYLRPRSEVFNMEYERPSDQAALGTELVEAYHVNTEKLPQCSTCHR